MITERKNVRGKIEILASILCHCTEGIKKTHIMIRAKIGYEQLCYYLTNLIKAGLVTQVIEDGSVVYRTTENGREFLKHYNILANLMELQQDAQTGNAIVAGSCSPHTQDASDPGFYFLTRK
jgi:predicted transcriptional regulator